MSEVFKARFDGREWWATGDEQRVGLWHQKDLEPLGSPVLIVPAHMAERIEELPPEPPVGTVLWDENDTAWFRDHVPESWEPVWKSGDSDTTWESLSQNYGPLHPYSRAARDEIERLTAERDEASGEAASEGRHYAELQMRIDDALRYLDSRESLVVSKYAASILRGEA